MGAHLLIHSALCIFISTLSFGYLNQVMFFQCSLMLIQDLRLKWKVHRGEFPRLTYQNQSLGFVSILPNDTVITGDPSHHRKPSLITRAAAR